MKLLGELLCCKGWPPLCVVGDTHGGWVLFAFPAKSLIALVHIGPMLCSCDVLVEKKILQNLHEH